MRDCNLSTPKMFTKSIYLLMLIYVQALQEGIRMASHLLHLASCLIKTFSNSDCIKWSTLDGFIQSLNEGSIPLRTEQENHLKLLTIKLFSTYLFSMKSIIIFTSLASHSVFSWWGVIKRGKKICSQLDKMNT